MKKMNANFLRAKTFLQQHNQLQTLLLKYLIHSEYLSSYLSPQQHFIKNKIAYIHIVKYTGVEKMRDVQYMLLNEKNESQKKMLYHSVNTYNTISVNRQTHTHTHTLNHLGNRNAFVSQKWRQKTSCIFISLSLLASRKFNLKNILSVSLFS